LEENMPNKSYNQLCPIAFALDVVGERWTLLILRELLFGPRRFKDILHGLPGIGTNLVAKRLRDLETFGVIRHRQLPPPSGAAVYELSELGEGLRPVMNELAQWGLHFFSRASENQHTGVVPMMGALTLLFIGEDSGEYETECELHVDGELFHLHVQKGSLSVDQGPLEQPEMTLSGEVRQILELLGDTEETKKAIADGRLELRKGTPEKVVELFSHFRPIERV
jgi:DNA-binding HxlR family transcriptional regulator